MNNTIKQIRQAAFEDEMQKLGFPVGSAIRKLTGAILPSARSTARSAGSVASDSFRKSVALKTVRAPNAIKLLVAGRGWVPI